MKNMLKVVLQNLKISEEIEKNYIVEKSGKASKHEVTVDGKVYIFVSIAGCLN
jgi:hypothetical protein